MGVPGTQAREKEDTKVEASGERDAEGRGRGGSRWGERWQGERKSSEQEVQKRRGGEAIRRTERGAERGEELEGQPGLGIGLSFAGY